MLSWLPHPMHSCTCSHQNHECIIGMEAQAFFPILVATSEKSRETFIIPLLTATDRSAIQRGNAAKVLWTAP